MRLINYRKIAYTILFCAFICVANNNAMAQFFKGFVSAGGNVAQIDGDEVYGFKKVGFTAGIGAMIPFNADKPNEGLAASLEINYATRGAKEVKYADPFKYEAKLDYIDIPLMLHWIDKTGGITLGAGFQYGRLVRSSENWVLPDTAILGMERPLITNAKFLKNDWAVVADLRFTLWQRFKLDVRYQYSLVPIRKDFEFSNSYNVESYNEYKTWKRNFYNTCISVKLIYVINEEIEQKVAPKRKTAF